MGWVGIGYRDRRVREEIRRCCAVVMEYAVDDEADVEVAREAARALEEWRQLVVALPGRTQAVERAEALEELVAWYDRIRADPTCADAPPVSGLDALSDELTSPHSYEELGLLAPARWAIRVCEELARWRLYRTDGSAPATVRVAGSRLDLALMRARQQTGEQ
jgi:hypothetical protein